jgi:hypothetical protein
MWSQNGAFLFKKAKMASISDIFGSAAILKIFHLNLEWSVIVNYQFSY